MYLGMAISRLPFSSLGTSNTQLTLPTRDAASKWPISNHWRRFHQGPFGVERRWSWSTASYPLDCFNPLKKMLFNGVPSKMKKTYPKAPTSCFWTMGSNHIPIVGPLKLHTVAAGASAKRLAFSETKEAPEIKADIRSSQPIPAVVWNRAWFDFTSEDTDVYIYILYTVYDFDRCCGFDLKPNSRTGLPEMGR